MNNLHDTSISTADKKLISICVIGSILEYFDFMTFIFVAPIITELFLPKSIHNFAILYTYIIIGISYFVRPVGGILLGHLSDRYGRRTILWLSLLLMAVPSLIISILPTYAMSGYLSIVLLIIMRMLQGISLGGEVPASITYIFENIALQKITFFIAHG